MDPLFHLGHVARNHPISSQAMCSNFETTFGDLVDDLGMCLNRTGANGGRRHYHQFVKNIQNAIQTNTVAVLPIGPGSIIGEIVSNSPLNRGS